MNDKKHINYIFKIDIYTAYILFIITIIIRYFTPHFIGNIFLYSILILFFFSKKSYFWLAFIFLLIDPPGYLFFEHSTSFSLPGIGIGYRSINYGDLFIIISLIKANTQQFRKEKTKYFFSVPLIILLIYCLFLFALSFTIGISLYRLLNAVRHIMPYLLFISLPRLLISKRDYYLFFNLLFSFVFILFLAQLIDIIFGKRLAFLLGETTAMFGGAQIFADEVLDVNEGVLRSIYGVSILLISFISSMFYIQNKNNLFNKKYLYFVLSVILLSIVLSATRGWMISFFIMLMLLISINLYRPHYVLKKILIPVILIIVMISSIPVLSLQFNKALERLDSITYLIKGDVSVGNTSIRMSERGPRVWNKFKENPILGWGFSDDYFLYSDGHVGHHTMLLNGGIVGYLLFVIFWIHFCFRMYSLNKQISNTNSYKKSLLTFVIGFLGIFIIHSSSGMIFGYLINVNMGFTIVLFFVFSDFIYKEARKDEIKLKKIRG